MAVHDELVERMARPQRHRLLQGFPAVPAMSRAVPARSEAEFLDGQGRTRRARHPPRA